MKYHIVFESVDPSIAREQDIDLAALNDDRAQDIVKTLVAFVEDVDFVACAGHQCVTVTALTGQEQALKRALYSHVDDYQYDRDDAAGVISFDVLD